MKKAKSSYDLAQNPDLKFENPMKYQSNFNLLLSTPSVASKRFKDVGKRDDSKHKVVIYFSDAYENICDKGNGSQSNNDVNQARRLANEMQSKVQSCENLRGNQGSKDFVNQLKSVLEEKSKFTRKFETPPLHPSPSMKNKFLEKPKIPEKPNVVQINQPGSSREQMNEKSFQHEKLLPSYIESIDENNVIKLKIEQNYKKASELVSLITSHPDKKKRQSAHETSSIHELNISREEAPEDVEIATGDDSEDAISEPDEGYFYDWSFVQEWRSR